VLLRKATKTEGLLASKIQIDRVTTAQQKPKDCRCPKYKSTMLPLHHINQNIAGVPDTNQLCFHYTTKTKDCWCPKYRSAVLPLCQPAQLQVEKLIVTLLEPI